MRKLVVARWQANLTHQAAHRAVAETLKEAKPKAGP
jgi:hypothetical protein